MDTSADVVLIECRYGDAPTGTLTVARCNTELDMEGIFLLIQRLTGRSCPIKMMTYWHQNQEIQVRNCDCLRTLQTVLSTGGVKRICLQQLAPPLSSCNVNLDDFVDPLDSFEVVGTGASLWSHMAALVKHPPIIEHIVEFAGTERIPAWWGSCATAASPDFSEIESRMWTTILQILRRKTKWPQLAGVRRVVNPAQLASIKQALRPQHAKTCAVNMCENHGCGSDARLSNKRCYLCTATGVCQVCLALFPAEASVVYDRPTQGIDGATLACGHPKSSLWQLTAQQFGSFTWEKIFGKSIIAMMVPFRCTGFRDWEEKYNQTRYQPTVRLGLAMASLLQDYPKGKEETIDEYLLRVENHRCEAEALVHAYLKVEAGRYVTGQEVLVLTKRCSERLQWVLLDGRVCCAVHPLKILRSELLRSPVTFRDP
mmetsp:Transcript_113418/g.219698  ORF Transcript_113418/g.219698 Transcript_113418/m.219698 type:complete len:428 (+) Transcript_113418:80-1363(+)